MSEQNLDITQKPLPGFEGPNVYKGLGISHPDLNPEKEIDPSERDTEPVTPIIQEEIDKNPHLPSEASYKQEKPTVKPSDDEIDDKYNTEYGKR